MAKGDSGEMGDLITNQNEARMQPAQDLNVQRTGTLYNNMNQNYGYGINQNLPDYSGIMDSYRSFLSGGAPSGGSPYGMNPSQNRGMMGDYNPYPTSLPGINGQENHINQAARNGIQNNGLRPGTAPGFANPVPPGTPRQPPQGGFATTSNPTSGQGLAGQNAPSGMAGQQFTGLTPGAKHVSPDNYRGSGANLSGIDVAKASQGLGIGSDVDHTDIQKFADNIRQQGHDVQPGPPDEFGRYDSLIIDGQIARVFDSSGKWEVKSTAEGPQWDSYAPGDAGYNGGQGGSPYFGSQSGAIPGWQDFAMTGGFTPQGIQDIRARAIAPTRAIYQNAQNDLATQKARTGGYMPNYAAAQADLARKSNYGISDANINANAGIAQMIQQGRLGGLQGLTGAQLGALQGMTGMFGASPGLAGTLGNQLLGANQQNLSNQSLQNSMSQILFDAKNKQSQIPSTYQQALGNVGGTMGVVGQGAMMMGGI